MTVMCYASCITGYGKRKVELSNATPNMKQDTTSIEYHLQLYTHLLEEMCRDERGHAPPAVFYDRHQCAPGDFH